MTLLAQWKLDEAEPNGNMVDSANPSASAFDLAPQGFPTIVAGVSGSARRFVRGPTQQFASSVTSDVLEPAVVAGRGSWTVAWWMKRPEDAEEGEQQVVLSLRDGQNDEEPGDRERWRLLEIAVAAGELATALNISWRGEEAMVQPNPIIPAPADDKWHHYAIRKIVRSDGLVDVDAFFDGALVAPAVNDLGGSGVQTSELENVPEDAGSGAIWWMAGVAGNYLLDGDLDEVRFYDEAISAQTVADLYHQSATLADIELALHDAVARGTGLPAQQVVIGYSNRGRPDGDGAVITIGDGIPVGMDRTAWLHNPDRTSTTDIEVATVGLREVSIGVQVFTIATTGNQSARALLGKLQSSLFMESIRDDLRERGFQVLDVGAVRNLTALAGADYEGRAILEFTGYVPATASEFLGYIASVEVTDLTTGQTVVMDTAD